MGGGGPDAVELVGEPLADLLHVAIVENDLPKPIEAVTSRRASERETKRAPSAKSLITTPRLREFELIRRDLVGG